jgi:hypothetical protein
MQPLLAHTLPAFCTLPACTDSGQGHNMRPALHPGGGPILEFPDEVTKQAARACRDMLAASRTNIIGPDGKAEQWPVPGEIVIRLPYVAQVGPKPTDVVCINSTLEICDHTKGDKGWHKNAGDVLRLMAFTSPAWPP